MIVNPDGPLPSIKVRFFDSDSDALASGLNVGDLYFLTANNYYGLPYGILKIVFG